MKIFIPVLLCLLSLSSLAQSKPTSDKTATLQEQLKGSYQVQVLGHNGQSRDRIVLPENIFEIISNERDSEKVVYYKINSHCRIKIVSTTIMNSKNFKALPQQVIVEKFN